MAYGIPAASLPPTAPPWPSQQRCPPERHAAMARMQQRREQRSAFGDEEFTMASKGAFEEPRRPRSRGARHSEVLEDSKRYSDDVDSKFRREKPPASRPSAADRRRHAEEELRSHHVVEEPPRSSRRHREEVEETQKRRDKERDREVCDRDREIRERDRDLDRNRARDREICERDRELDRDRDMDRDKRHDKTSRKKQQDEEEPLPPEVAKADFSTLQEMIAKQIKEAERQTELPELKPIVDDDSELRLREQRRKQREEEEQRRVEERKRLRKEREEARLREIQESQRREEEEEERKKEEEQKRKAEEQLQARKNKAATKIQARYRGNCSRTGKKFAAKPVEGNANGRAKKKKKPDEEGDLLM